MYGFPDKDFECIIGQGWPSKGLSLPPSQNHCLKVYGKANG